MIIGKPPTPRTGHTFADVSAGTIGRVDGVDGIVRAPRDTARYLEPFDSSLPDLAPAPTAAFTRLALTPVEPESDPAVTTYGELEPGRFFHFTNAHGAPFDLLCMRIRISALAKFFYVRIYPECNISDILLLRVF